MKKADLMMVLILAVHIVVVAFESITRTTTIFV
jgi:hypothetical protein